jgi:hypothetical protein
MTSSFATASTIGGVLALVLALLNYRGARSLAKGTAPDVPKLPYSTKGMSLMGMSGLFAPAMFGLISVVHAEALVSTALGASLCLGMCVYFFLKGWAYLRSPEMRDIGPYFGTYLAFGSAFFYAIAVVGNVI